MASPTSQTSAEILLKKVWGNPELILISRNEVHGGAQPSMKEIHFTPFPSTPGRFQYNGMDTLEQFTYDSLVAQLSGL